MDTNDVFGFHCVDRIHDSDCNIHPKGATCFFSFSLAQDSTDLLIGGGNSGFSTTVRVTRVDGEQLSLPRDLPETHVS